MCAPSGPNWKASFSMPGKCFERGMSYDAALQSVAGGGIPLDSRGMVILSSYCEFTGKLPESTAPPLRTT